MKKNILLLLLAITTLASSAQKFESRITILPQLSMVSDDYQKNDLTCSFSIAGAFQEYYKFNEHFALGTELRYSYNNFRSLVQDYTFDGYSIHLTTHSLSVPIMARFNTKSNWFLNVGFGAFVDFAQKARIDLYSQTQDNVYDTWEPEMNKVSSINTYLTSGIGKQFKIQNQQFSLELVYELSFAEHQFGDNGLMPSPNDFIRNINRPQNIGIRIGAWL